MNILRVAVWVLCLSCAGSAMAKELVVHKQHGPYHSLKAAAAAAQGEDTITLAPGWYRECAVIRARGVTVRGMPGEDNEQVKLHSVICQGKAILVTAGNDITVENLTLQGARAPDKNGAGIRAEGANLRVNNVRFVDNENGILTTSRTDSTIQINGSLFERNGSCEGSGCAHGLYAGQIGRLIVRDSRFIGQQIGHHIKSRALYTEITQSEIEDGPWGTASYLIDLSNGGNAFITRNRMSKGALSGNRGYAIAIAFEGDKNPGDQIIIEDNIFTYDGPGRTAFVGNRSAVKVRLHGNELHGEVTPLMGPGEVE